MSNQHVIETPENISFGYDVAGIGSRFLATLIDTLIQGITYTALVVTLMLLDYTRVLRNLPPELINWVPIIFIFVLFLVQFGYFLLLEIFTNGQTPGKRLFKLRVVKENGYPLSAVDCIIRNLVRIIDFFPFGYGVGLIVMFCNDNAKRLGDYAAGTLVVKMRDEVKLSDLQKSLAPGRYAPDFAGLENLRARDIELIESFLQRRYQIKDTNISALSRMIADSIRARMNSPQTDEYAANISHEDFLQQVIIAYRRAHQRT